MSSYATDGAPTPSAPAGEPESEAGEAAPGAVPPEAGLPPEDESLPEDELPPDAGLLPEDEPTEDELLQEAEFPPEDELLQDELAIPDDAALDGEYFEELEYFEEPAAERPPVSKLAIIALVTGVLPLVPLAVGFGTAALASIRRTGRRGRSMAVVALFATSTWIIAGGAFGTVAILTHGFKRVVTIKYHEASVFKVREGDCINTPNGQTVTILPCTTPHDAQVFATFTLPRSAWPGTAAVQQTASADCVDRLSGYVNPQLSISLSQAYVYPDRAAWDAGTRTVICEVRATSGQLTESVR
jgi:hypothetical protein